MRKEVEVMNHVVVFFGKAFIYGVEMRYMTDVENSCLQLTLSNQCCNNGSGEDVF